MRMACVPCCDAATLLGGSLRLRCPLRRMPLIVLLPLLRRRRADGG